MGVNSYSFIASALPSLRTINIKIFFIQNNRNGLSPNEFKDSMQLIIVLKFINKQRFLKLRVMRAMISLHKNTDIKALLFRLYNSLQRCLTKAFTFSETPLSSKIFTCLYIQVKPRITFASKLFPILKKKDEMREIICSKFQ